jgi:CubicO group peptidase (beta-lactamase class C family)
VDTLFAEWDAPSPGCALGVFTNGAIAYSRGYGIADAEHDVRITPETVFYVGSLSKQFTAMTAALAIKAGKLSAADSIRRYLPELPEYAAAITVEHLLHHTSGLRDYNTLLDMAGRRGDEAYDNATVLRITARQRALNFQPGSEYLYSNTGYTLLASIVERAVGQPFAAFADEQIFRPLGMTVTHYHVDATRLVHARALAYERGPGGRLLLDTPNNQRAGAGGLYTNIPDLLRWDENFYTGRVGGDDVLREMQTAGRLNDGKPLTYAWGLEIGRYRGLPIVEHGGALGGYRAHLLRFPSQHASIAVLCNLGGVAPDRLARQVADLVLADRFTGPADPASSSVPSRSERPEATSTGRDASSLTPYTGSYYSDEIDATFAIAIDAAGLTLRREGDAEPHPMSPNGADQFRARDMTIRFERTDGRVTAIVVDAGRVRGIRFVRKKNAT